MMTYTKRLPKYLWFCILIFSIFLIPRLFNLGNEGYGSDSQKWLRRSDDFIQRLSHGRLKESYVTYHPGVTVMWLSGGAKRIYYNFVKTTTGINIKKSNGVVAPQYFQTTLAVAKIPLVIFISLLLALSAIILNQIGLSKLHIIIFALLLSLEPFFLGVSTQLHLTGLETALGFSAIVATLYYLKTSNRKLLIGVGVIVGLGLLTKVSFLVITMFVYALILYKNLQTFSKESIKNLIIDCAIISLPILVTVMILWPATWLDTKRVINSIILQGFKETALVDEPSDSITKIKWLFYPEVIIAKSLTITSLLFVSSIFIIFLQKKSETRKTLLVFLIFIAYYLFLMTIPSKVMHRYVVVIYPFVIACASYVLVLIIRRLDRISLSILLSALVFYYIFSLYLTFPNYSMYYSELVGYTEGYSKKASVFGNSFYNASTYMSASKANTASTILLVIPQNKSYYFEGNFNGKVNSGINQYCGITRQEFYLIMEEDQSLFAQTGQCDLIRTFGNRSPDDYISVRLYLCKI